MTEGNEQSRLVGRFLESLTSVVDLGYAEDECDTVVTLMFQQLVRDSVQPEDLRKLPFRLPASSLGNDFTHAQLLTQATQLQRFVERSALTEDGVRRRDPILFPFITALAMAGGIFLIIAYLARWAPAMLGRSGPLS